MFCLACEGTGWRRRQVPNPIIPGHQVTETKVCPTCKGRGHVNVLNQTSGKDKSAQEETNEDRF